MLGLARFANAANDAVADCNQGNQYAYDTCYQQTNRQTIHSILHFPQALRQAGTFDTYIVVEDGRSFNLRLSVYLDRLKKK